MIIPNTDEYFITIDFYDMNDRLFFSSPVAKQILIEMLKDSGEYEKMGYKEKNFPVCDDERFKYPITEQTLKDNL